MRPGAAAVLAACVALIVLERVHTYAEPLERDIAGYAVIGHEMIRGRHLYTDLWERKPPLLYATFRWAEWAVGYGPQEVFLINVTFALATLGGCYAAGRAAGGTVAAGLAAAGAWALVGGDLWLEANQPNGEVFVNAALTAAAAVLFRPGGGGWRTGLAAGGLFALASLYEQHVVVTCAALAGGYVLAGGRPQAAARVAAMGVAAGVGAVAWAGLVGYLAVVGRLPAAMDVLFRQLFASSDVGRNLAAALRPEHLWPPCMAWAGLIGILWVLAAVAGRRPASPGRPRRDDRPGLVWAGWAVGTGLTVALPGYFFAHYYQLWVPPMCVAGGVAVGRLLRGGRGLPALARGAAVTVVMAILAVRELRPYAWPADEWPAHKAWYENFGEQAYLARRLAAVLRRDESFWVFGSDNTLYFMTGRSPVTGLLYVEPLLDDPKGVGWARLTADLDRARPALVLIRLVHLDWLNRSGPLRAWILAHYDPTPANLSCPSYGFWVRRGDADLRRRLGDPPPAPPFHPVRPDANR